MKEFIEQLNWPDYLLAFGILRGAFVGYKQGLLRELLRASFYIASLVVLLAFKDTVTEYVSEHTVLHQTAAQGIVALAMTLGTYFLLKMIGDLVLKIATFDDGFFYKVGGVIAGVARWIILVSLLFYCLERMGITAAVEDVQSSLWAPSIQPWAPRVIEFIRGFVPPLEAVPAPPG